MTSPIALVTGASNGIGRTVALALAARQAHVMLVGRDVERLTATKAAVEAAGGTAEAFRVDLANDADLTALVRAARKRTRAIDVLVHAAGVARGAPATMMPSPAVRDSFDEHMALNVRAPMQLTAGLVDLVEAARGLVVLVGSVAALRAAPGFATYAASKSASKAWADALREELAGRGVRVSSVHPGQVATDMQRDIYAARGADYRPEQLLQPAAVAELVAFLYDHPELEVTELTVRSSSSGYVPNTQGS